ncbi:hypothetical protein EN868_03145 [Mesorhizobium sp. M2D.F.Ca.ET.225.01.1.1]|uniref:hypothetical protein n=1 Tax=unclassified Mesorhizobium TaxID=325217 RepID=UPI000FD32A24|nr:MULTISPECIES: hypothetical protein [unclassified Mesorhizobium]TGP65458.1 hypothetical protein EN869_003150 [Mesorhizobium sp. M2D.F.Ca.ET.226.01.1.1]TGP71937.1 hypothetical protein EN868_03145 [Mesorhizobium sp. M2D.F.Ca.ET.225.01.1.1]
MADNISIKDSAGATVVLASKDVGGVQYPRRIAVDGTGAEVAVATSALQTSANTKLDTVHTDLAAEAVLIGDVAETAPASDTASSGLNGRLQRIAQRLTSLIALIPAALGQGTMAQSLRVVLASDQSSVPVTAAGNVASGAADSGNPVKIGGVYNSTLPTLTTGQRGDAQLDVNSNVRALSVMAGGAGSDGIANSSLLFPFERASNSVTARLPAAAGFYFNGSTWDRQRIPSSSSRIVSSANTTNATVAKASAGWLSSIVGLNTTGSAIYLKLYNKATSPTVGTDTPVLTIPIPASGFFSISLNTAPYYFSTGISYALTGAAADADTTAVAAGAITGLNLLYS